MTPITDIVLAAFGDVLDVLTVLLVVAAVVWVATITWAEALAWETAKARRDEETPTQERGARSVVTLRVAEGHRLHEGLPLHPLNLHVRRTTMPTKRQSTNKLNAEREASELGVHVDDLDYIRWHGKAGWVYRGGNGEFYGCTLSTEGHAFPVGSVENVRGRGELTPLAAAVQFVKDGVITSRQRQAT